MTNLHAVTILSLLLLVCIVSSTSIQEVILEGYDETPLHIHEHWMRYANTLYAQLTPSHNPCPFNAFAAVVVNHCASTPEYPLGKPICTGVNGVTEWGNPTLHGEIAAINNCSRIFKEEEMVERNEGLGGGKVWKDLTIYSTAEPCPMCASAIRWTGFKEVVFGTRRSTMVGMGWSLIDLKTEEVFERSGMLEGKTGLIGGVLSNETDPYFAWQYDETGKVECPKGCRLEDEKGGCVEA